MTQEALLNLQRGIPEDTRYPHTTYNPESDIDKWVLRHVEMRENARRIIAEKDKVNERKVKKELEKVVSTALDDVLKGFNR